MDTKFLKSKEFYSIFIAVNYIKGNDELNANGLLIYLEKTFNNLAITKAFLNSLKELEKDGVIARRNSYIAIVNVEDITNILLRYRYQFNTVEKIVDDYNQYETNRMMRAYDMMIDQEAVDMYRNREHQEMLDEFSAHNRFSRYYK